MTRVKEWLEYIGIDISLLLAGLIGSLMMVSKKTSHNLRATLIGILSGTLSANYLSPFVADIFSLQGRSLFGIAFLLGYTGLRGVESAINHFHKKASKI